MARHFDRFLWHTHLGGIATQNIPFSLIGLGPWQQTTRKNQLLGLVCFKKLHPSKKSVWIAPLLGDALGCFHISQHATQNHNGLCTVYSLRGFPDMVFFYVREEGV